MSSLRAKKRFGQHFLISDSIIQSIVNLVEPDDDMPIIEIGPGRGALTIPLSQKNAEVLAVEYERSAYRYLKDTINDSKVTFINKDFLALTDDDIRFKKYKLVGNLPYNITSPVIDWAVRHHGEISMAVFMLQKEVALRLTSSAGSRHWSPIAIMTQLYYDVEYCFDVSPQNFKPPPKVNSAVVKLTPKKKVPVRHYREFEKVVRSSFRQRRKLLVNNLVPEIIENTKMARDLVKQMGLKENIRAEEVSTDIFFELTERLIEYKINI